MDTSGMSFFTGRAMAIARCRICLSELHSQADCPEAPNVHFTPSHTSAKLGCKDPRQTSAEICRLFNDSRGNRCTFQPCKYAHICADRLLQTEATCHCPRYIRISAARTEQGESINKFIIEL